MKGLSLWQPVASLIAWKEKQKETRSWGTNYRGDLLICATAGPMTAADRDLCWERHTFAALRRHDVPPTRAHEMLPRGAALAVVNLVGCYEVTSYGTDGGAWRIVYADGTHYDEMAISDAEFEFGDFTPGRFVWVLSDLRPLPEPMPCKGGQRLWTPSEDLQRQVEAALASRKVAVAA